MLPSKEMVVGRDEDCDLRIASTLVSRRHCSLMATPEGVVVKDLGSQNGTHVNDVPINEPTLLREGDTLRIGAFVLSVPAHPRVKLPPGQKQEASENEIADWLTEPGGNTSGSDTAVISMRRSDKPKPSEPKPQPAATNAPAPAAAATVATAATAVPAARPTTPKQLSIKEEAAEVIRKHWEKIKASQK